MVKNGRTPRGAQRWLCKPCGATTGWRNDVRAKVFAQFLDFILGKTTYADMPGQGRTFRRRTEHLWCLWPISMPVEETYRVIHVDGIYLRRIAVVLIAQADTGQVVAWHVARSETTASYASLLAKIPPPQMVVADGASGFVTACKQLWPNTCIQRCTFHVQSQILRYTTRNPRTQAGVELMAIAKQLGNPRTLDQRYQWVNNYYMWCHRSKQFLSEITILENGTRIHTHQRLVKARNLLNRLIRSTELFTYLDPSLYDENETIGTLPATNNRIEGAINSQLRQVLHQHRGMSINHQLRLIGWWLYMHTPNPPTTSPTTTPNAHRH